MPRRAMKKEPGYGPPDAVREILNRSRKERPSEANYSISENTKEIRPKIVPKSKGDTVSVIPGPIPKEMENNFILEVQVDQDHLLVVKWIPKYEFYVGQFVNFWIDGVSYTFQIRPTERRNIGEFALVAKENMEQQPGVAARTDVRGGGMASYAR